MQMDLNKCISFLDQISICQCLQAFFVSYNTHLHVIPTAYTNIKTTPNQSQTF